MTTTWLRRFFGLAGTSPAPSTTPTGASVSVSPPDHIQAAEAAPLELSSVLFESNSFARFDWHAITNWIATIPDPDEQAAAWGRCEIAWLQHLQQTLGADYRIEMADDVVLLTSQDTVSARTTLSFVAKSRQRIERLLSGLAEIPEWGHDMVIVFDDEDSYYRYASHYYPDEGEFAFSSGMYLGDGCGHFITIKDQVTKIEPVIVHELTHALLGHLPIPTWLNEGLAVNTEHRFYPPAIGTHRGGTSAAEQHQRHQQFWGTTEIQQFWSGESFKRTDEGNELSYDLARILVEQFSADWPNFQKFANEASYTDGGAQAAQKHLGLQLGSSVCALLEREHAVEYEPVQEPFTSNISD